MLLLEENCRLDAKQRKPRLSRHYYDLWCLIKKGVSDGAIRNTDLFNSVAEHRAVFFKQNWMDYNTLKRRSLRLIPPQDEIAKWKQDYSAMRGVMFFGEEPDFEEILEVVRNFEKVFNQY